MGLECSNRDLVAGYLAHLGSEKRRSPLTCKHYGRDLERLLAFAGAKAFGALSSHDIRRYLASLHGGGLSARSLARMLSAWRGFCNYLARDHGRSANPCLGLRAPKIEQIRQQRGGRAPASGRKRHKPFEQESAVRAAEHRRQVARGARRAG